MEAPSPSAGRKRSNTHLTCKQPSRAPHLHCPNPACMRKHIYRRRCECGKACVWRCPQCEAVVSASNAARHKCRPSMAAVPQAPPVAMRRRLLWVMRGLEHHNRVPLPSDFLVSHYCVTKSSASRTVVVTQSLAWKSITLWLRSCILVTKFV